VVQLSLLVFYPVFPSPQSNRLGGVFPISCSRIRINFPFPSQDMYSSSEGYDRLLFSFSFDVTGASPSISCGGHWSLPLCLFFCVSYSWTPNTSSGYTPAPFHPSCKATFSFNLTPQAKVSFPNPFFFPVVIPPNAQT